MKCERCDEINPEGSKFCRQCGVELDGIIEKDRTKHIEQPATPHIIKGKRSSSWGKIIIAVVFFAFIGFGAYGSVDKEQIETNNEALIKFDAGDSKTAIEQFRKAANEATSDEVKVGALINLAYAYSTEGQTTQSLSAFKEALPMTTQDSFDYYLITGEIALLEGKINDALTNYNNAYRLNPEDFQINNALALFHLDLEDVAPRYVDYSKALLYAKKAYELSPSEISKQNLAIAYYFNKKHDETISLLSASNFTQHPYAAYWIGLAYFSSGDDTNAEIFFQIAIDNGAEVPQEIYDYLYSN